MGLQEARSTWEEKRALNCVPQTGRKRQRERVDYKSYSNEEDFSEFFNVGSVQPLGEWLSENGFVPADIGDVSKQINFAEEVGPH